jgi:hypothetical protein
MQITSQDTEVTTKDNAVDNMTEIMVVKTSDQLRYVIEDNALLIMDLKDSENGKIPANSKVYFGVKPPLDRFPTEVDDKAYRPFFSTTLAEQYDDEKNRKLKLELPKNGVSLPEGYEFSIWLESSVVVDHSQSVIEINDVEKKNM